MGGGANIDIGQLVLPIYTVGWEKGMGSNSSP